MLSKKLLRWGIAVLFLLGAATVKAQTPPTPTVPSPAIFTFSGNIAGFNGPSATNGAVIGTAALQVTNTLSAGYEHISVSSLASRWELGVLAYTRPLNQLLGTTLSNKINFDTGAIAVTFSAGAGKLLQPTVNRIAETVGVHISYPIGNNMSVQIIGVDFLHGGVQSGTVTVNMTEAVSTGINFSF